MVSAFDNRIITMDMTFPDGKSQSFGEGFSIYASGSIFGSAQMNTCECRIFNLTRELTNYILTQASPLKSPRTPILLSLNVGRASYGTFLLFIGNVISCDITQPPDKGITFRALNNNFFTGAVISSQMPAITLLSTIAQSVAASMNLTLINQSTDKQIDNWSFTQGSTHGIEKLNQLGVKAACDGAGNLIVLDPGKSLNTAPFILNASTGMIGIPQVTDVGVNVKMMINNSIKLLGSVTIQSDINPAANGTFTIIKINYEVATRDQPFWYTLVTFKPGYYPGTQ